MKKNMGSADRIIRSIIAIISAYLYFSGTVTGTFGLLLIVLAVVFAVTSFISFCPLYAPFGLSTCDYEREELTSMNKEGSFLQATFKP